MVSDNKQIYIHLGIHKTGSTFFQKTFYPKYPEFNYLHLRGAVLAKFNQYILRENELTYRESEAKELFLENLSSEKIKEGVLTLCEEQFAGAPLENAATRKIIFDRLNALFPQANYLIVLRNPKDFIRSMYAEYLKKGGTASLENFLKRKDSHLNFSRGAYLEYEAYYRYIISKIGQERIKVLYYEDFKKNPIQFLKNLTSYFKLDIEIDNQIFKKRNNVSFSTQEFGAYRFYNSLGKTSYGPDHIIPKKFKNLILKTHKILNRKRTNDDVIIDNFLQSKKFVFSGLPEYERIKNYGY